MYIIAIRNVYTGEIHEIRLDADDRWAAHKKGLKQCGAFEDVVKIRHNGTEVYDIDTGFVVID